MLVQLSLYTRTGCHLCEDMEHALPELAEELGFTTEIFPIDNNPELERLYGSKVPVLMLGEQVICEYFLDKVALSKAINRYVNEKHT